MYRIAYKVGGAPLARRDAKISSHLRRAVSAITAQISVGNIAN